jgi:hypothetical protein
VICTAGTRRAGLSAAPSCVHGCVLNECDSHYHERTRILFGSLELGRSRGAPAGVAHRSTIVEVTYQR